MRKVLIIAPHPDDETLGCGGTIVRHIEEGDEVHWVIVTSIDELSCFTEIRKNSRREEIQKVKFEYGFKSIHELKFNSMQLDVLEKGAVIAAMSSVFNEVEPDTVYVPYRLDAHSDHEVVHDAAMACTKSFRYPFIKTVRVYETLSETEFGMRPEDAGFKPNTYVDISSYLSRKIEIMSMYKGEMGDHPFPRSVDSLKALALLRGAVAGCYYAEGFMTVKEIV